MTKTMTHEEYFDYLTRQKPDQVYLIGSRMCVVTGHYRALYGPGRGRQRIGGRYTVRYRNGECDSFPEGEFYKRSVTVPPELLPTQITRIDL